MRNSYVLNVKNQEMLRKCLTTENKWRIEKWSFVGETEKKLGFGGSQ
jgi:hypothetical protein